MSEGRTSDIDNDVERNSSTVENEQSSYEMDDDIQRFQMRRKWETRYVFFTISKSILMI